MRARLRYATLGSEQMQEHSSQQQRADHQLVQVATLGYQRAGKAVAIALLAWDTQDDQFWAHFPHDLSQYIEPDDLDVFECIAEDLRHKAETLGTGPLFEYLANTLSNVLLISEQIPIRNSAEILECAAQNIFGQPFPATQDLLKLTQL
jgi:hypothetical protein